MKRVLLLSAVWAAAMVGFAAESRPAPVFKDTFDVDKADLTSTGRNLYFVLEPGYQLVLEGEEGGKATVLTITVRNETKRVDGVETRVVEEKETVNGQVVEISRNFFAFSKKTRDVFYFGEEVDNYRDGKVVDHEGSWLSGVDGARFGLMMPGRAALRSRYMQEIAPGVAMDRAEIVSLDETLQTPAGSFSGCLKTEETSALEAGKDYKVYAAAVGLILDGKLKLTKRGRVGS